MAREGIKQIANCGQCGHVLHAGRLTCPECQALLVGVTIPEAQRNEAIARYERAFILAGQGKPAEVIQECLPLFTLAPLWAEPYRMVGEACAELQQYREAMQYFHQAVKLAPDDQALRNRYDELIDLACLATANNQSSSTLIITPGLTATPAVKAKKAQASRRVPRSSLEIYRPYLLLCAVVLLCLLTFGLVRIGLHWGATNSGPGANSHGPLTGPAPVGVAVSNEPESKEVQRHPSLPVSPSPIFFPVEPTPFTPVSPVESSPRTARSTVSPVVVMPACVGLAQETATARIEMKGLIVNDIQYEESLHISEGIVLRTSPSAGRHLASGQTVVLVIARASRIPAIIGLSPSEAKARLRAHGLSVAGVEEVTTRKDTPGVVVSTRPDVGEPYPADRQVYLQVGK